MSGPPAPARGALAGVKADFQRAKAAALSGETYNPVGAGSAWSHNFLNQKPWHPLNYRNQITKWEAEQKKIREDKIREQAQAEFDAEQEYMKTLSYLTADKQKEYRDKQSVSFMYQKPPGLEAALAKEKEQKAKEEKQKAAEAAAAAAGNALEAAPAAAGALAVAPAAAAAAAGGGGNPQPPNPASNPAEMRDRLREDPYASILTARAALQTHAKFILKHGAGGRSPPRGGFNARDANQQMLLDDPDPAEHPSTSYPADNLNLHSRDGSGSANPGVAGAIGAGDMAWLSSMSDKERRRLEKVLRKAKKAAELEAAQATLRAAGYDLGAVAPQPPAEKSRQSADKADKSADRADRGRGEKRSKSKHRRRSRSSGSSSGSDSNGRGRDRERKRHRKRG